VHNMTINTPRFSLIVGAGCDGLPLWAILSSAMVALKAPLRRRLSGILGGLVVVMLLNQLRIVTLIFMANYRPQSVHFIHHDVFPPLLIVVLTGGWLLWANWANSQRRPEHASS